MSSGPTKTESIWIWPFELTEKIGEGGMAAVYRARYVKDDRQVAVKLLPEETISRPASRERFQREMEVLKKLRHPNIVRCFGGLCENQQPFYAMELVDGGTLDDLLRKAGKRTWKTTAECGLQMCAGLAFAHAHGVVHRDVKPANFLIDGDTLKLSDFGLAMLASGAKLTAADRTVGTFDYMAPEQISGGSITPRTDLYALGGVFFEMMTGRPPFEAQERVAILHQHLKNRPPLVSDFAVDCPPDLDRLIDDLLEKNPADRPSDADEVAERLQKILNGQPIALPPKRRASRSAGRTEASTGAAGADSPMSRVGEEAVRAATAPRVRTVPESSGHWTWLVAVLSLLVCFLYIRMQSLQDRSAVGPKAVAALVASTDHAQPLDVRLAAIHNLGYVAEDSEVARDRLVELLGSTDPRVRTTVVEVLGQAGSAGRGALSKVIGLQRTDSSPEVRKAAELAIKRLRSSPLPRNAWWTRGFLILGFIVVVAAWSQWPHLRSRQVGTPKKRRKP